MIIELEQQRYVGRGTGHAQAEALPVWSGWNGWQEELEAGQQRIDRVIASYDELMVRMYCHTRFRIIHRGFLNEILQYLPSQGRVLEPGCGFGLVGLYFAQACPGLSISGLDIDARRIRMARKAAENLGLENIDFQVNDASQLALDEEYDAAYMLDILHHIPTPAVPALLQQLYDRLRPGGVLVIKDVDTRPLPKMVFTWVLDYLMTAGQVPTYWSSTLMSAELRRVGFDVFCHSMVDLLPYPHRLYLCIKPR